MKSRPSASSSSSSDSSEEKVIAIPIPDVRLLTLFKKPDGSPDMGPVISMLMPSLNSPMGSNSLTSILSSPDILSAGKSMLSLATLFLKPYLSKAQALADKGILAMQEPAVAPKLRRFATLLMPILEAFTTNFAKKNYSETKELRKLIYYTLAQGVQSEALDKLSGDSYIKATLLQRAAHIVDLEMVYAQFIQEVTKNLLEGIFQQASNIFAGTYKQLLNNPMEMLSNLSGIYKLYDYLPYNKFRVLFIHPDSLWESGAYIKHKEDTQFEHLKTQLVSFVGDNSNAFLDKYARYLLVLRQEMNKICDLLAANDRHLIQYCKEKNIDETEFFNINKTCILELLNGGLRNIASQDYDKQRKLEKVVKTKIESVNEHNSWVQFENSNMQSLHQFGSNMQDISQAFYSDPAHMMNVTMEIFGRLKVREWLLFLNDITNVKTISEIYGAFIKHVGPMPFTVHDFANFIANDFLSGSKTKFLKFMLKLEVAQKGGEETLKIFLRKHWISMPFLQTVYTPKIKAQIEVLDENEKSHALERLKHLAKQGRTEAAKPLLKEVVDLYEPFKIALENDEGDFCILVLKAAKKKDKDLYTLKPVESKEQEKILRAVLAYIEKVEAKGLQILQGLMAYEGWNKKTLEKLTLETENNIIKNILLPQQKPSKSKKSESVSSSSSTSLSTALISLPSGGSVSSLIFKPVALSGMNPIMKIQIFAEEKCGRDVADVQCFGLVMSMIQFFQAYVVTGKNNLIPGVSIEHARCMRNALVHQQVYDEKTRKVGLILDGEAEQLSQLANALVISSKFNDSKGLVKNPLFNKLLEHGRMLAKQKRSGLREDVMFCHRLMYTHWLGSTSLSLNSLRAGRDIPADMLAHAKAALNILKQLYCLRESGCSLTEAEHEQAKLLRHLNDTLPMRSINPKPEAKPTNSKLRKNR